MHRIIPSWHILDWGLGAGAYLYSAHPPPTHFEIVLRTGVAMEHFGRQIPTSANHCKPAAWRQRSAGKGLLNLVKHCSTRLVPTFTWAPSDWHARTATCMFCLSMSTWFWPVSVPSHFSHWQRQRVFVGGRNDTWQTLGEPSCVKVRFLCKSDKFWHSAV